MALPCQATTQKAVSVETCLGTPVQERPSFKFGLRLFSPSLLQGQRLIPLIVAALLMLTISGITLNFWAQAPVAPAFGTAEELFLEYTAGSNYARHGFLNRGFLTDYSLDNVAEAPPVYYTHQPPLPGIVVGALISAGLDSLQQVRLVMMFFFLAGLVAVMVFVWHHFTPWHAVAVVAFLGFNGRQVLPWVEHTTFAYWFGLSFVALWAFSRRKEPSRVLWVGAAAFFLISLMNYIQVAIFMFTFGCLWLARWPNLSFRRLSIIAVSVGVGVAAHMLQNLVVLGPQVFFQEVANTVGNRMFGSPTRQAIQAFYQEHSIILFGTNSGGTSTQPLSWIWTEYSFFWVTLLISLAGLGTLYYLRRKPSTFLALRLFAGFALGSVSFHVLFPAMGEAYPLPIAVATPIAMAGGLFLGELVSFIHANCRPSRLSGALTTLAILSVSWAVFSGFINYHPFVADNLTELDILQDFKGETFWTNVTPQVIGYVTKSWVIGQVPLDGVKKRDVSQAYVIAVNRNSPTWNEVSHPHYFFFSLNNVVLNTPDRDRLEEYRSYLLENYQLVAWSRHGSMIVDMTKPLEPSHTVRGIHEQDLSGYSKIELSPLLVTPSSVNGQGQDENMLVSPGVEGFWHAKNPRQEFPAWVTVDLGTRQTVSLLRLRPREGFPSQLWDGPRAALQTSDDSLTWTTAVMLGLDRASLKNDWVNFPLSRPLESRYLRLAIYDLSFTSIGRLEFYVRPQQGVTQDRFVKGTQQASLRGYTQLELTPEQVSVSSINSPVEDKGNIVDPMNRGYWHVKYPRQENLAWVAVDLWARQPVSLLRVRPREGFPSQLWDGPDAALQTSDDRRTWLTAVTLELDRASLQDDWVYFPLSRPLESRYLRIAIFDDTFYSIGSLEFYAPSQQGATQDRFVKGAQQASLKGYTVLELAPEQVTVSSSNSSVEDKGNIADPMSSGYWHVRYPRQENPAWVAVDLGANQPVSLLRLRPRKGFPTQLWDGPRAALQTSDDGLAWTTAVILELNRASLQDDWVYFPLSKPLASRYLRLAIFDDTFYSIARIELYQPTSAR